MMQTLLLLALNGLIWGLIIALIALGLSIIFGLLDIINIAHGDFFMVGTVLAWFTLDASGNFWLGFIVAPLIGFFLGALIQRVVIQPIRNVAALSIVATFGLSLILQETVRITFGPSLPASRDHVSQPFTAGRVKAKSKLSSPCFSADNSAMPVRVCVSTVARA